jgi:mRNA interferase MazF
MSEPTRAEIWWVEFDPAVGSEANKTRPGVVVSSSDFDVVRTRLVVPLTSWQERFIVRPHRVLVSATDSNGIEVDSTADVLHLRSLSVQRFRLLMGVISDDDLAAIQRAILTVLGMDPQ